MSETKLGDTVFAIGAFRIDGESSERGEGSALHTLRVRTGKAHTTLDRYEVMCLRDALAKWIKATDSAKDGGQ